MVKIGIELNGIVRDINTQILKYYKKDINKEFDDESADKNVVNIAKYLDFGSNKKREEFLYVDYPYEVFGCARTCERNLASVLNNWLVKFTNIENEEYEVVFFSTNENALTIQSTYYFLSKIGCRVREMYFPKDSTTMWDKCDVIITTNKNIVDSKPDDKKVILIEKNDNSEIKVNADFIYQNLTEVIEDEKILDKLLEKNEKKTKVYYRNNVLNKIKHFFK